MRLTADLILSAAAYINPIQQREISLRGYKIPSIENLGVTQDQYQVLDLSDNELLKLDNFPMLTRLESLLLNNNQIVRIAKGLGKSLPKLNTLILTRNKIASLKDLLPLIDIPTITHLSLLHNPVSKLKNYRLYLIHKLPKLKVLDFKKIKQKEREASIEKFGEPWWLKKKVEGEEDKEEEAEMDEEPEEQPSEEKGDESTTMTAAQRKKIVDKVQSATSLDEIEQLSKILKSGKIPKDLLAELE